MINHYLAAGLLHLIHRDPKVSEEDKRQWLLRLRAARWREVSTNIALQYDFEYLGGAKWLRKRKDAAEHFHARVVAMAAEWQAAAGVAQGSRSTGGMPLGGGGGRGGAGGGSSMSMSTKGGGDSGVSGGLLRAQAGREQFIREQMWRMKKGHLAHGAHKVMGLGGGGEPAVVGGGDRPPGTGSHRLTARVIDKVRAHGVAEAAAAAAAAAAEAGESSIAAGDDGGGAEEATATEGGAAQ